ncbi:MAG: ATP-binding protein [Tepidisphaerales bacterium]
MLDFVIPSDFAQSRVVQDRIIAAVEALQYSDNDLFAIKLALEEAMINAIKHGNRLDPTKTVTVHARVNPEQVEIIIEDQGAGFDRADVPDPTDPANLEKSSGRGILLIEAYMTKVEWSNQGRRLRMCKTREAQLAAG